MAEGTRGCSGPSLIPRSPGQKEKARMTDSVTEKIKQICKPRSHKAQMPSKETFLKPNRCPRRWLTQSTPPASLIAAQIRG